MIFVWQDGMTLSHPFGHRIVGLKRGYYRPLNCHVFIDEIYPVALALGEEKFGKYLTRLRASLQPGGQLIIGGFASGVDYSVWDV